jgi:hypothetical protein
MLDATASNEQPGAMEIMKTKAIQVDEFEADYFKIRS